MEDAGLSNAIAEGNGLSALLRTIEGCGAGQSDDDRTRFMDSVDPTTTVESIFAQVADRIRDAEEISCACIALPSCVAFSNVRGSAGHTTPAMIAFTHLMMQLANQRTDDIVGGDEWNTTQLCTLFQVVSSVAAHRTMGGVGRTPTEEIAQIIAQLKFDCRSELLNYVAESTGQHIIILFQDHTGAIHVQHATRRADPIVAILAAMARCVQQNGAVVVMDMVVAQLTANPQAIDILRQVNERLQQI